MSAPIGNKFWKIRSKHGRDKLFATPELLWEAACEYFEWCEKNPFYEVEQVKQPGKAFYDKENEEWVIPDKLVSLPKMRPFTLQGLCGYLDCATSYFRQFKSAERENGKDFVTIITRIEETIYNQKFSGAASGFLNPNIIARDLGLTDKVDNNHSGEVTLKQITGMIIK